MTDTRHGGRESKADLYFNKGAEIKAFPKKIIMIMIFHERIKIKFFTLFTIIIVIILASTSCEGPIGPEGPQGPQGEQGPPGPVGPAGSDGSIIHAGQGAPDENTGKPGDFYLDLATGNLFGPKMVEGWGVPTNLQGSEGPRGPAGEDGQDGEQGPQGPAGEDGQDGQDGQDGKNGSQIFAGNSAPGNSLGQKGDYYLDKTNFDLYGPKTGSEWGTPVNLQGPQGEQGPQGPEGPAGTTNHSALDNLDADDHLQYLLTDGVRDATNGFAVTGTFGTGNIPIEGESTRLMWYPGKGAFRAGQVVTGDWWNDANIGSHSVATGRNTTASGNQSTAMGNFTTASGSSSTAMGFNTTASGDYSTAMGRNTTASDNESTAMGNNTTASGRWSTAMGFNTTAIGNRSTAMGNGTTAVNPTSLSIGSYNFANSTSVDGILFVAGNGDENSLSDALVLSLNGNMTIAGTLTQNSDRRLKTKIEPLQMEVIDKLGEILPVRYHFKDSTRHPVGEQLGLIAQEVQAQFPELVNEGSDGYLSLSYSKFTTVLLKGLQEQQVEIKMQQAEIEQLRSESDAIRERLAMLEQQWRLDAAIQPVPVEAKYGAGSPWILGGLVFISSILFWGRRRTLP